MKKITKIWLITAVSLVMLGCILFAGVMTTLKWDFSMLSTVNYETNTYEVGEAFDSISIDSDTADIVFALSDDGKCRVVCHEKENTKHSVAVENGALTVKLIDERTVYNFIGLNFNSPKITVYLPKTDYTSLLIDESTGDIKIPNGLGFNNVDISLSTGDVEFYAAVSNKAKIKTSTGSIKITDISAGALDLSVSTGNVTLSKVTCEGDIKVKVTTGDAVFDEVVCESFISDGSTGDVILNDVIAAKKLSVERSTGDVKFNGSDAAEIYVKTDTGRVSGTLLSSKVFITETDTGSVDVPKTASGGRCEITTDTGDIKIKIK